MANLIQHKRSSTSGVIPAANGLSYGELAINYADAKLYTKRNDNSVVNLAVASISGTVITPASGTFQTIQFDTNVEPDLLRGQIGWNDTEGTVNIALTDDTDIHIGEHSFFRVRNSTSSTLYKGQPVYASGVHANGIINPNLYVADGSIREVRFMGLMLEDLNQNNNGYAIQFGHLDIDTRGNVASPIAVGDETWAAGDILYIHPTVAGKLTNVEPKHSISAAIVLSAASNGLMFVRPTSYGHLDDNHDVSTSGVTDNQYLRYDSSSDIWVPTSSGIFNNVYASGNVGIGAITPTTKLDVSGVITATGGNSNNWNTSYGWGNHASAGYLTSLAHNHGVANSAGTQQFTFGVNDNIRFAGSGSTSVTFNPSNKLITISSSGVDTTYSGSTSIILNGSSFERASLSGDVTAAQNNNTTTISNDAVTNIKLANMAVNTIKGRITAGTGDPEDLTAANVRTILNVADGANNYVHPTDGANTTITAANLKVLSAITVNNLGHVTSVSSKNLIADDIPGLDWSKITSGKPTTLSGYGITDALASSLKGANNGLAELDSGGKVPSSQLPSYVDDVLEYAATGNFPVTGETGKIYVATGTNLTYRWSGSAYVEISASLALGETSSTAYRGDRGKEAYDHSQLTTGSIHGSTTVGGNLLRLTNPSAIRFLRVNADNTVSALSDSDFRTAIGAGTSYTANSGIVLNGTVFSHIDTSSQNSVDNSDGNVIQDITLDTYGHITALGSVNLDNRYLGKTVGLWQTTSDNLERFYFISNGRTFYKSANGHEFRHSDDNATFTINTSGNCVAVGNITSTGFIKSGGTSSQFLKADGSVDSTAYTTNTGTVTSVAALTLGTTGTDVSSTVVNGTTTPVITLNIPTASASNRGALSSTDWSTFNNKAAANQTMYIGTTAVAINRASASLSLTGVSIDGNAGTVTNGVYTTGLYAEPSWITSINYNKLTGTIPTWNQNTTGTSAGVIRTVTGTNTAELVRCNMGDNDNFRILAGATASNAGYAEIATADDGNEPIYVRQYTGVFTTLTRTATLLDASGNTTFPGSVTAGSFVKVLGVGQSSTDLLQAGGGVIPAGSLIVSYAGSAGSANQVANTLTRGSYLTGNNFNGSAATTWTVDATSANTADKVVARDASGNFSAGTISGAFSASADQGIVNQQNGNTAIWRARILSKNSTADKASFLGTYGSIAGVFAQNNALNAWADLYVNTVDGSAGGIVRMPTGVLIGGNTAWHAGNDGAGSTLDADLLDGNHASAFYLASNPNGYTTNTGTVTSIATNNGLTGGTITTTGTIGLTGQALALHNLATNGIISRTGSGTVAARTISAGTGISVSNGDGVSGNPTITNTDLGSSQNIFKNIAVAGQSTVVADSNNDTLTFIAGTNITITTDATNDTVTINSTGGGITGTGTTNYISKWTSSSAQGNSIIFDNGTNVGIGTTSPGVKLDVRGTAIITNSAGNNYDENLRLPESSNGYVAIHMGGAASSTSGTGSNQWAIVKNNSSGSHRFDIRHSNTAVITALVGGNVGIGTESPSYKLQVNGSFGATTKSFRIDHPSRPNHTLEYGSLESPYHGVRLTGRGKVIKGVCVVDLPPYLKDLVHDDENINIQLTNYKHGKTLYVSDIDLNNSQFTVRANRAKTVGDLEFFWTFSGVRKDVENLVVEKPKEI